MKIRVYGLLHLCEKESSAENVYVKNFKDQVEIYLNCAIGLSNSLKFNGVEFTLLTNKKYLLDEIVKSKRKTLKIREIPFNSKIPSGINFYSAHFKLDAFRYLANLDDNYVGLCDLDVLCINDVPESFLFNIKSKIPMFYDISDQVIPAIGQDVVIQDLRSIHGLESEGRWAGGEFISGTPEFFKILIDEIDKIYDSYIINIGKIHHVGDEAITSAALEMIRTKGVYVADAGTLGIVGRFWNSNTLHPQKPFDYFKQCFLIHLPADKEFLSDMAKISNIDNTIFCKHYAVYKSSLAIQTKKLTRKIMKRLRFC